MRKPRSLARRLERRGGRLDHFRLEGAQFLEHRVGAEEEVAGIPQIAFRHVALGGFEIGLLDEGGDAARRADAERLAGADVAVTDRRLGRRDAERDDRALAAAASAAAAQAARKLFWSSTTWSAAKTATTVCGSRAAPISAAIATAGAGIAARRLDDDRRLGADLLELLAHQEAVVAIGDDDRLVEHRRVEALDRLLEGRGRADQRNELLRHGLARFRPHPRAGAAAHDDRQDFPRHFRPRPFAGGLTPRFSSSARA